MFRWTVAVLLSAVVWSLALARAGEVTSGITPTLITQEEAIARALNASAAVGSRQEMIAGADANVRQSAVLPNPEINAELENFAGSGSFRNLDDSELTLGLSQRIERTGKRDGRVAVAEVERDIATIERDRARLDTALAARRAYVDVSATTLLLEVAQARLESAKQIEAMAVRRVRAARDPITVKLRAEIQTAQSLSEHSNASLALQTAKKRLGSLWGDPSAAFNVETAALLALPESRAELIANTSPDVRVSEAAARRADSKFDLENANASSDVSVGLGVRRFENGGDLAGVISFSMPLAIFDTNQGNIERADAERRAAALDVQHAKRELEREVLTLQGEIARARAEVVVVRGELMPRAEAALKAARHGYDAGAFSYLELSESQRTLNELRTREIDVLRQLHFARAGLDRLSGRLTIASSNQRAATMRIIRWVSRGAAGAALLSLTFMLVACGEQPKPAASEHGAEEQEFERGKHNGRLLRSGDFALEITIFETGVPPEFHVYAYQDDKPVVPTNVRLTVTLKRLGGKTDKFTFKPDNDHLVGSGPVEEPHSFDVLLAASYAGKQHNWSYDSYEGRTVISEKSALQSGVTVEKVGPATIKETIELLGHLELAPGAKADLRARFPGKIISIAKNVGDPVNAGESLARIESNESLQAYAITAPFAGVVLERNANAGDVTTDAVLFSVGNPSKLMADFHVFDRDAGRVKAGQSVRVVPVHGPASADAKIATVSPIKDPVTQTIVARVMFENATGGFLPGMSVRGHVIVEEASVPLAVKTSAIQRFRDFEVVFAKQGETYEVRMLEIGRRTVEWTEVLSGIDPGQDYVVANSFLIKADIEKSGASHDH